MTERPSIPQTGAALILNDMINANLRTKNSDHNRLIEESGIVQNSMKLVKALRERKVPILWIRVERRADYADAIVPLTDAFLAGGRKRSPAGVRGTFEAANVDELPVQPEDQVILKPRLMPMFACVLTSEEMLGLLA